MSKQIGRLALRHEGENWNAYYALQDTMEGAMFLGSIRIGAVAHNDARKQEFMNIMMGIVSEIIEDETGERPSWADPKRAPEHERSGHG